MGYRTHVTGEFTIVPPLPWNKIRDSKYAPHNVTSRYDPDVILRIEEETVDTEEGPLFRRKATALVMREIDEYRADNLIDHVQNVVNSAPGHDFVGYLECEGEENTDIWRVYVKNGEACRIEPKIVWPEM
jgi:hypothetical protein